MHKQANHKIPSFFLPSIHPSIIRASNPPLHIQTHLQNIHPISTHKKSSYQVYEQVPKMWNNTAQGGRLGRPGPATGGVTEQVPKMWAEGGRLGRPGPAQAPATGGVRGGEYHIPVSSNTPRLEPSPFKRHNTAHYYAHRVKENFSTQMTKAICAIFLGLLLIVGIITFIIWLSLRPHRPRFHIQSLSIPPSGLLNVPITFNATARNPNMNIGIYYESMSVTCKYNDAIVGSDNMLVPFLYQQPKNTTMLFGVIHGESYMTVQWPATMRLEFTSLIRFKISSWWSKNHTMHANCEVVLGMACFCLNLLARDLVFISLDHLFHPFLLM